MKKKNKGESFEELDRLAHSTDDIRPLSPAMRSQWEAAKRTGAGLRAGRSRKNPVHKPLIVPIAFDPTLLKAVDKFAKSTGTTRSRLVAEGVRLRMKA